MVPMWVVLRSGPEVTRFSFELHDRPGVPLRQVSRTERKCNKMAGDATVVAPHIYSVVEENDRVRVLKVRVGPGEATELHSHPDHVAIITSAGKFRFTTPDGESMEIELEAGQAFFVEAGDHRGENIGDSEVTGFAVELK